MADYQNPEFVVLATYNYDLFGRSLNLLCPLVIMALCLGSVYLSSSGYWMTSSQVFQAGYVAVATKLLLWWMCMRKMSFSKAALLLLQVSPSLKNPSHNIWKPFYGRSDPGPGVGVWSDACVSPKCLLWQGLSPIWITQVQLYVMLFETVFTNQHWSEAAGQQSQVFSWHKGMFRTFDLKKQILSCFYLKTHISIPESFS